MMLLTSKILANKFVAYSDYEQRIQITHQDRGYRVLTKRRELVYSANLMMVASPGPTSSRMR